MCDKIKTLDEIGKFNCVDKLEYIKFLEKQLQNSYANTSINGIKIKKEEEEKCLNDKINAYKKEYDSQGCGKNQPIDRCITLKQYINSVQDSIINSNQVDLDNQVMQQYKSEYAKIKCDKVFSNYALGQVNEVSDKYKSIDKLRIESASRLERNKRIYFGGLILISAIVMFKLLGKKK
jgi:hypothetical protein